MSNKSLFVMDMPEKCLECQMLNSVDACVLQIDDQNLEAETWDDLISGCPLKPIPEEKSYEELSDGNPVKAWGNGWNACIDVILKDGENEKD